MSHWTVKNVGQFGRRETTVLSDPGNCLLTDCHSGANFIAGFVREWEAVFVESHLQM